MDIIQELENENIGDVVPNVKTSTLTTYRVGGMTKALVYPNNIDNLIKVINICQKQNQDYMIIGKGSNLLFSDHFCNKVLINLNKMSYLERINSNEIKVSAGYSLVKLANEVADMGLSGLEFASSIPGSVGGAIYMNAGAYNSDISKVIKEATILTSDNKILSLCNQELEFDYRESILKKRKYICLDATFVLEKKEKMEIKDVMKKNRLLRMKSQPTEYPSAGSVFRNPENNSAGRLIEDAGLKGLTKGGAMVSEKHANFIVNYDNATYEDIKYLINYVHDKILEKYNIDLKTEQEFVE